MSLKLKDAKGLTLDPFFIQEGRPLNNFIYLDEPNSGISKNKNEWSKRFFSLHESSTKEIEINKNGFRCEEFKKQHEELHILFMGCSVTWGTGLNIEETWSKKLYDKFLKQSKLSGYFNIGVPGDSIFSQVSHAFKYFKNFGNPNLIFFNIPDLQRFYAYSDNDKSIVGASVHKDKYGMLNLLAYQYYYMLEQYCYSNNIKLMCFTWERDETNLVESNIKNFNTFYSINQKKLLDHVDLYCNLNPNETFALVARDNMHFGTAYSDYWANFIYDKYKNLQ
jgi:hypothetical protein